MEQPLVLVTGSSGLIGRAVVDRLAGVHDVVGLSRHPRAGAPGDFVELDVTSDDSVQRALDAVHKRHGQEVASVVHLAAYYDFSGEPSPLYQQVTVDGTRRLLNALQAFAVEQFWFSSTMLVHEPAERPGDQIEEEDALRPAWDYPRSKLATERLLRGERGKIPVVLARIAGVYDEWCHSIPIAHQVKRIAERDVTAYVFPGEPSRGQAFLHLADLVDAVERSIERRRELPPELPVLLGEREAMSYDSVQDEIGRLLYGIRNWPTLPIPKPLATFGAWAQDLIGDPFVKPWMIEFADDQYEIDVNRACSALGWEPRRALRATLPAMLANFLADPERWYGENDFDPATLPDEWRRTAAPAE
jgi:nucleoside-diphosphate-sugar epimerase